jgi:Icc-related predicted phosphoesterase
MTAAVTIGSTTQNFTFDVVVPQEVADAANVASAIAAADGDALFIEGVVTSVLADGTFTIEDADGTAIYVDDYSTTYADFDVDVVVAVGDLVQVTATKSNYNGFHSIDTVSLVTIVSNGNAITDPIVVSDIAAFRAAVAADSFGKRYVFTNVVLNDSGYYLYFYDESGANRMGIVESMSSNIATTLATADVLNMVVTLYGSSGTYTDSTKILRFAITQDADALVLTNVAGAIAAAADDALYFSGVVTSVLPDGTFTVEDADGTAIYVDDYNTAFADFDVDVVVTVGDMVQIVAAKSDYNGYHSIDSVSYVSIESSGNAITDAIAVSDIAAWKAAATADSFGKRYVFTDVTIDDAGYYLYFYNVDGTNRMGVVESMSSAIAATIGSGDTVTMTVTLYGTNGTFTDASKIFRFAITQDSDATITPAP